MQEKEMVKVDNGNLKLVRDYEYVNDLGNNVRGSKIQFKITVNLDQEVVRIASSCGCTTPTEVSRNPSVIQVEYNGNRLGVINQWVKLTLKSGKAIKITLAGRVD